MILALDASISSTGFALVDFDDSLIDFGKITTTTKMQEDDRVYYIANKIANIMDKHFVKAVIMEAQFFSRNVKTAMQLSRLRGAITFVIKNRGVNIIHRTPSEIRKDLTGNGSATKEEVCDYIRDFYKNDDRIVELGELIDRQCKAKNSDIYDAIGIGLSYNKTLKKG